MFSVSDTVSKILALVGPVALNGQRDRYIFNTVATCIAFLRLCRQAAAAKRLREVLSMAQVSYASYWRLSHGCRSFGMTLCVWPALREAMTQANLEVWEIKPTKVYEASAENILEHRTVVAQEMIVHTPNTPGFREIVGELAPQVEIITAIKGGHGPRAPRSSTTMYNGRKVIQQGTPAFAKLVKSIVAGEFID